MGDRFSMAVVLGIAAITSANCEPQSHIDARLSPCPGIVIGSDIDDHVHIRNTTGKAFDDVHVFVGGVETLYGKSTTIGDYRAFLPRLDPSDDVDLTDTLAKPDGSKWRPLTMKMASATVASEKVCESGFVERARGDHKALRRLEEP
jgi:hypothetical protein